jgi:SPP1 family predicted phage head-tail adaptor
MVKGCAKYSAGDLRDPCAFQREVRTPDGAGGWVASWQTIAGAPSRCMFKRLSGSEMWRAMRVEAKISAKVVCRAFADLSEGDRVIVGGRAWNIRFIGEEGTAGEWFELAVEGGVAT